MALVKRLEDLRAWQAARELVKAIYDVSRQQPFASDWGLRDQIQRAAVSAMTNIAEGFDCDSHAEFIRFLGYARRSVAEVHSLLYTALDVGYIDQPTFEALTEQCASTKALIGGLLTSLRRRHRTP